MLSVAFFDPTALSITTFQVADVMLCDPGTATDIRVACALFTIPPFIKVVPIIIAAIDADIN